MIDIMLYFCTSLRIKNSKSITKSIDGRENRMFAKCFFIEKIELISCYDEL